jgi:hypothetical protein
MDLADSMQRQALKIAWHLRNLSLPNCEEQFVILSSVQGQFQAVGRKYCCIGISGA